MENLNKNIGERIAKLRKESNITQAQLAEKLNISIRHCSSIECGNARLSIEKLIEVADLFHVTLDYLILGRRFSNKYIDLFPDTLIPVSYTHLRCRRRVLCSYRWAPFD